MIFHFAGQFASRLCVILAIGVVIWITVVHGIYRPLPLLSYAHDNRKELYIWQADCGSVLLTCPRERLLLEGLHIHPVAQWSPDGQFVAVYLSESWAIYPADCLLGDQNCKPVRLERSANDTRIAWGPQGSTLAYIADSSSAEMKIMTRGCWDKSEAQYCFRQSVSILQKGVLRQVAWAANGSSFAFLGLEPRGLFVLDSACLDQPETCPDTLQYLPVNMWPVYWPSLSADGGELLYFADLPDGVEQIFIAQIDDQTIEQLSFRAGGGSVPAWSADERYIAFAGFQNRSGGDLGIYVLDRQRGLTARAVSQKGQDFAYPAWNP